MRWWREWSRPVPVSHYNPHLDVLRACAVMAVLYSHFWNADTIAGDIGVRLFFVLSGYLITRMVLAARAQRSRSLVNFYARRALRLWPAYYGLILLGVATNFMHFRPVALWHGLYLSNFLFAWQGSYSPPWTAAWWSLAVEEQFYLIWPALAMLLPVRFLIWLCVAAAPVSLGFRLAVQLGGWPDQVNGLLPACIDVLGAGALLALLTAGERAEGNWAGRTIRWIIPLWLAGLAGFAGWGLAWQFWMPSYEAIGLVAIVAAAIRMTETPPGNALILRSLAFLGRISYGMYLYHLPVWFLLIRIFGFARFGERGISLFALCSALTILMATLSWFALELPFNRLKRHFPFPRSSGSGPVPLASARAAY